MAEETPKGPREVVTEQLYRQICTICGGQCAAAAVLALGMALLDGIAQGSLRSTNVRELQDRLTEYLATGARVLRTADQLGEPFEAEDGTPFPTATSEVVH